LELPHKLPLTSPLHLTVHRPPLGRKSLGKKATEKKDIHANVNEIQTLPDSEEEENKARGFKGSWKVGKP